MKRDLVTGTVGATLLVAAMAGVFILERNAASAPDTGDSPHLGPKSPFVPALTGTVAVGDEHSQDVVVPWTSATHVVFRLTWTATNGKNTLQLNVVAPAHSNITEGLVSDASDSGTISLSPNMPPLANATGDWKVTVAFLRATPNALPGGIAPPTPPPNSTDATVAYRIEVTLS
jgi:hypothetical protein